ncbi:uncharacterized protein LOC143624432 [Bidens hawaiensis]|uniref:uncharacterized protein LOC143624432 n=1 Tax=Bidens hawaiensis TaxID=980011 RepID=UPI00404A57A9
MWLSDNGKSRLSIELASRFFKNSEIINCGKMQVYNGLDIITNKVTMQELFGVSRHLLGGIDPTMWVFIASDFQKVASEIISEIKSRHGLPVVVGGSIWYVKRIDATEAFRAVIAVDTDVAKAADIWEKQVVLPSMKIVKNFLIR